MDADGWMSRELVAWQHQIQPELVGFGVEKSHLDLSGLMVDRRDLAEGTTYLQPKIKRNTLAPNSHVLEVSEATLDFDIFHYSIDLSLTKSL